MVLFLRVLLRSFPAVQRKATPPDEEHSIPPPNLEETINELKNAVIEMRRAIATMGTHPTPQTEAPATVAHVATNLAHSEGQ
jgi:uncharacterized coiled-coil protein SlyX